MRLGVNGYLQGMKNRLGDWLVFILFAFCIIYPSTTIFKKLGVVAIGLYSVLACAGLWVAFRYVFPWAKQWVSSRLCVALLAVAFVGLTAGFLVVHPHLDTDGFRLAGISFGSTDTDDAIDIALSELLAGRYPYYPQTFLGLPISPMPGALLLALPFYALGNSALQNIFWLAVFVWMVGRYLNSTFNATFLAGIIAVFFAECYLPGVSGGRLYVECHLCACFFCSSIRIGLQ